MLFIHIIIALTSVIFAGYTSFSPSLSKIRMNYVLIAGTIASGTILILITPFHMISVCVDGLLYVGIVTIAILFAKHRLASRPINSKIRK